MRKHKIIEKQFKCRERIRASYGLERLKTTYRLFDDSSEAQVRQEPPELLKDSTEEDYFCLEGYFEGPESEEQKRSYNPYDLFQAEDLSSPPPDRLSLINSAYVRSMEHEVEQVSLRPQRVRFDPNVWIIYFDENSPPAETAKTPALPITSLQYPPSRSI